jgi:glycosyltransferase involved in cell wall biosynthesis
MTRPRVLHVIPSLITGGAEHMLASLATAKRAAPYQQVVVSLMAGGVYTDTIRNAGVPVYEFGLNTLNWPIVVFRLAALIRKLAPATIQSWLYYGDLFATFALYLSGRRRDTKLYWGLRSSDISQRFHARSRLMVALCVRLSRLPDAVIANSYSGRDDHRRIGYRPPAFAVIPNGIDTGVFRPDDADRARIRAEFGLAERTPFVIHVGRVNPMKDHATFLQVAAALPEIRFAAIGRGTEGLQVPPNVLRLGVRQDMPAIHAAADALVSTSLFGEGFSNVIAEAMASGVPVAATDVGDAREIVGDTGLLAPPGNAAAIADSLLKLLSESPQQRQAHAKACRERIVERFSLEHAVTRFDRLYAEGIES